MVKKPERPIVVKSGGGSISSALFTGMFQIFWIIAIMAAFYFGSYTFALYILGAFILYKVFLR